MILITTVIPKSTDEMDMIPYETCMTYLADVTAYYYQFYFMGCVSSSEIFQPKEYEHRAIIYFLGGGPGSPKQQVIQFLTQRYKFKYLSVLQLINFQENAGSPETIEIRKHIQEKTDFPSDLILRVLKKVIVLYGPRKYLIDNFPRNMADVVEFQAMSKKYQEVRFQGYLQLDMQEGQMKESGMSTLGAIKKDVAVEEIEKEVRTIIEGYRGKIKPILQHYQQKQELMRVNFVNSDSQLTIAEVEKILASRSLKPVQAVPFFFMNGNDQDQLYTFALKLARIFRLKFWSIKQLKEEFRARPEIDRYLKQTKEEEIEGSFLVELISKKLEKYNYKGMYMITGFPRHEKDVAALKVKFRSEVNILSFVGCLHTPTTQKQKQSFEKLHQFLTVELQDHTTLINSSETSFNQILNHTKLVAPSGSKGHAKVVIFPMFENQGLEHLKKLEEWCDVVDFSDLLKGEIKAGKLASDLLNSCINLKRPVPSYLAGNIFTARVNMIRDEKNSRVVVFKGFPENIQQLKVLLSRSQNASVLCGMFIESSRIRKNRKEVNAGYLQSYELLCKYIESSCDKTFKISEKTTYQELQACISGL